MTSVLYSARGNRYVVTNPSDIPDCGTNPEQAIVTLEQWVEHAIQAHCHPGGEMDPISDGLIVGPFENAPPFNILIVNTDGSLAERSGNGLTIFAQALRDTGVVAADAQFDVHVHHATPTQPSPVAAGLTISDERDGPGVWVAMGEPAFGPEAVAASPAIAATSTPRRDTNHVAELADIDERWTDSVLVRVGNPHCVTWVSAADELPDYHALSQAPWYPALKQVAFAPSLEGGPATCPMAPAFAHGINLQWAARLSNDRIAARIYERGEGPTRSSGSSATAVACTARQLGLATADVVQVEMPGGTATVRFEAGAEDQFTAFYLGVAEQVDK